jgi:hypothetical protein
VAVTFVAAALPGHGLKGVVLKPVAVIVEATPGICTVVVEVAPAVGPAVVKVTLGVGTMIIGLTPVPLSSVAPRGITPPASDVPVVNSGDAVPADDTVAEEPVLQEVGDSPPPSKLELVVDSDA